LAFTSVCCVSFLVMFNALGEVCLEGMCVVKFDLDCWYWYYIR